MSLSFFFTNFIKIELLYWMTREVIYPHHCLQNAEMHMAQNIRIHGHRRMSETTHTAFNINYDMYYYLSLVPLPCMGRLKPSRRFMYWRNFLSGTL